LHKKNYGTFIAFNWISSQFDVSTMMSVFFTPVAKSTAVHQFVTDPDASRRAYL